MIESRKTILFDSQIFDSQIFGGISRYFANLIDGLPVCSHLKPSLPILHSNNYYIRHLPRLLAPRSGQYLLNHPAKQMKWNKRYMLYYLRYKSYDLIHPTYYDPYFLDTVTKPIVVTLHDMIYENFPDFFKDAENIIHQKKLMLERATLIITISEFSKQQILKWYPHLQGRIKVVYHGISPRIYSKSTVVLPNDFLLYVGDRKAPYKNFRLFVSSIAPILRRFNFKLICAGSSDFTDSENQYFSALGIKNDVLHFQPSDAVMQQLYGRARVFIYPSLEEGFGLPILEAFQNQCAIACSNTSCLPEVGGEAVNYFDPSVQSSIYNAVLELLEDAELCQERISNGVQRLKKFSMEEHIRQTVRCYEEVLSGSAL